MIGLQCLDGPWPKSGVSWRTKWSRKLNIEMETRFMWTEGNPQIARIHSRIRHVVATLSLPTRPPFPNSEPPIFSQLRNPGIKVFCDSRHLRDRFVSYSFGRTVLRAHGETYTHTHIAESCNKKNNQTDSRCSK